jgi:hypothetical protein
MLAPDLQEVVMASTKGRKDNAAEPLGERRGTVSKSDAKKTGKQAGRSAGPDGPSAERLGDTFKR